MAQKITLNEGQLREKVYNMVCESLEEFWNMDDSDYAVFKSDRPGSAANILAQNYKQKYIDPQPQQQPQQQAPQGNPGLEEGKTFKDQKSWDKKGFQKSNKFQKNDKYQNWKNGGQMGQDQDECMNEGLEEVGFMDKMKGAVGGFRQGAAKMGQTGDKAIIGQAASDCLPYIQRAMNSIQQGASREALADLTMVYNLIGRWAKAFGMEPNYAPAQRPAGPGNPYIQQN